MEDFKRYLKGYVQFVCTTVDSDSGKEYQSYKVGIVRVLITFLFLFLVALATTSCGTVDRIVDTSEKIIQGEVYYQAKKGAAKVERASHDAEERIEKKSRELDKKLKKIEKELNQQIKEKQRRRKPPIPVKENFPVLDKEKVFCRNTITLLGVKEVCDDRNKKGQNK